MDLTYLDEKEIVALCFNNIKETAFILYKEDLKTKKTQPSGLSLVEEDFYHRIIRKRYKLLQYDECNIVNPNYKKNLYNAYEGFSLHFWEASEKLFVVYPFAYVLIYDYDSTELIHHFQVPGTKVFTVRNLVASPIDNWIFISGDNLNFIYCLDYSLITKGGEKKNEILNNKIVLSKDIKIYDMIVHPNEKFVFVGYADGFVRIYDYNNTKRIIKELSKPIIDLPENSNTNNNTTTNDPDPVTCLDINKYGNFLIEGTEKGNLYLWDAFQAIKEKEEKNKLYQKDFLEDTIFSCKFVKNRQFGNIQTFICITKKGTLYIYFIYEKDVEKQEQQEQQEQNENPNPNPDDETNKKKVEKNYSMEAVYKKDIYEPLINPNAIYKLNILLSSLINISYNNSILAVSWPKFIEPEEKVNNNECTLVYTSLITKLFLFYSSEYPKINYPTSIQLRTRPYATYVPVQGQPNFENKIYYADNYYVYLYDISSTRKRVLINYAKEFGSKNINLLKFDVRDMITKVIFFILIENEYHKNFALITDFDFETNKPGPFKIIQNINDFVILGNSYLNIESDHAFLLGNDKANGLVVEIRTLDLNPIEIGKDITRAFHSPFNHGYCMIYKNVKNEYKFTQNFTPDITPLNRNNQDSYNNLLNLRCGDLNCFQLGENERITDIIFHPESEMYFCVVSMLDKINIYNREMKKVSYLKFDILESPYITSSLFFLDNTLIYSRGNKISYFYPNDNINQLIIRNNRQPCFISGVLPDRLLLVSQIPNDTIFITRITTPMINPLEPILIGYLDSPNINYDFVKYAVVTMFTNQVSPHLIDKFLNRNLKAIAWMFIDDEKSTYPNLNAKIDLLNENCQFDCIIDYLDIDKDLKKPSDLKDIIWSLNYDENYEYIKNILIKESKILIEYGQYKDALKILELLGDYPLSINLLLLSTTPEDFDMLRIKFETKESLNFTDNLFINQAFNFAKKGEQQGNDQINVGDIFGINQKKESPQNTGLEKMDHYHKIFDNYEGEHFIFGANQNEFKINSIDNIQNFVQKPKSIDFGIQKRNLNPGEQPFKIFSDDYNMIIKQFQSVEICSLILQKIENYYGIKSVLRKDENENLNKTMTFFNYSVTFKQIKEHQNLSKEEDFNTDTNKSKKTAMFVKAEELGDDEINENTNIEDIKEDLYLTAYYHMDRGAGDTIEDITNNNNNAKIKCIYNDSSNEDDLKQIWSDAMQENEPLEYEDKWGRRSPPGHPIIFTKKLKTKITVNHSGSLVHLLDKFTIELWIKLKDLNGLNIFTKEALAFDINNGKIEMTFHGQEIPAEQIKDYTLPLDQFIHVTFLYKRTLQNTLVLLNCEPILQFNFILSGLESNTPLVFGSERFDGEMAEIRIWNQRLPIEFIKENYKCPLAILAEKKQKITMNIEKEKKSKRLDSTILFENSKVSTKNVRASVPRELNLKDNDANQNPEQNNNEPIDNNNLPDSNNNNEELMTNDFGNEFGDEEYPTMDVVSGVNGENPNDNNSGAFFNTASGPNNNNNNNDEINFNT